MNNNKNFKSMAIGMMLVIATFAFAIFNHADRSEMSMSNIILIALGTSSVVSLGKTLKDDRDSDQLGQL